MPWRHEDGEPLDIAAFDCFQVGNDLELLVSNPVVTGIDRQIKGAEMIA